MLLCIKLVFEDCGLKGRLTQYLQADRALEEVRGGVGPALPACPPARLPARPPACPLPPRQLCCCSGSPDTPPVHPLATPPPTTHHPPPTTPAQFTSLTKDLDEAIGQLPLDQLGLADEAGSNLASLRSMLQAASYSLPEAHLATINKYRDLVGGCAASG